MTLPLAVRVAERAYIMNRRRAERRAREHPDDEGASRNETGDKNSGSEAPKTEDLPLVGLALSGGGIRSATFSMGILQTLARKGVLRLVDYMCTVSGGGYIGACLSSLLTIPKPKAADDSGPWKARKGFAMGEHLPFLDPDQIHHLRKHGDFLILRKGLVKRDVLRAVGSTVVGLACSIGLFLILLAALAGLFIAFIALLGGPALWPEIAGGAKWPGWAATLGLLGTHGWAIAETFVIGVVLAVIMWFHTAGHRPPRGRAQTGETAEEQGQRRLLRVFAILLLAIGIASSLIVAWDAELRYDRSDTTGQGSLAGLALPLAFFFGASLVTGILYVVPGARLAKWWTRDYRSLFGAMHGIGLYCMVGSALLIALVLGTWWSMDVQSWVATGGAFFIVVWRLSSGLLAVLARVSPGGLNRSRKTLAAVMWFSLFVGVVLLLLMVFVACAGFLVGNGVTQWWSGLVVFGGASVLFVVLGYLIDFNRISPHCFYRDRLAEAYLQTEIQKDGELRIVRDDYFQKVATLHDRGDDEKKVPENPAPYHLILCSLNLAGSRDLARKNRKSDHFIFAREYCGSSTTGYVATKDYRGGKTKLCTAMTISGAAAASAMGFYTSFRQAFAMTLFNIRLGYWLLNPRIYDDEPGKVFYPNHLGWPKPLAEGSWFRPHRVKYARRFGEKSAFWPKYLSHELRAATTAQDWLVNLSDGGHTGDNLGLYPLLQRRCRLIIVCDAECDPDYTFNSLTAAIRQIYIDENVKIDINLETIRPRAKGKRPRAHYAIGRIRYPHCRDDLELDKPDAELEPDYGPLTGWIIYLKSSLLMRGEHATVQSYAARNDQFPHQATADQFFDDDQFEAYRALGDYIAKNMLRDAGIVDDISDREAGPDARTLIDWCESQYQNLGRRDRASRNPHRILEALLVKQPEQRS